MPKVNCTLDLTKSVASFTEKCCDVSADQAKQAVQMAKAVAANRLVYVERFNTSIFTDQSVDVDRTTVHMRRMHPGGGLK